MEQPADGDQRQPDPLRVRPVLRIRLADRGRGQQQDQRLDAVVSRPRWGAGRATPRTPPTNQRFVAMWRYIVRRLLWVAITVVIITMITFLIFFVMPPTDPAVAFAGKSPTPEAIAEVRHQFGLDRPVWAQYGMFLRPLFAGD